LKLIVNFTDIQCIADMKQECDAHGLEYEILMQESAKARFLRQVKQDGFNINDLSKHLIILKQKRASNSSDPNVGAAKKDETVAAAKPAEDTVALPIASKIASMTGLKALSGLGGGFGLGNALPSNWNIPKILVDARNAFSSPAPLPTINLKSSVTLPSLPYVSTLPPLPAIKWPAAAPAPSASRFNWLLGSPKTENVAATGPVVSPNSD
jgi:hypothetical protein